MTFALLMAWREMRAAWVRLAFFFVCVGLGVAAIVVLRSVVQDVRLTLAGQARSLLGADVVVQSPRTLPGDVAGRVSAVFAAAGAQATTSVVDTQTMAAPMPGEGNGAVKLVELRGVEAAFPFYGEIILGGGIPYSHQLLEGHGAIVEPELLVALGEREGDAIRIAGQAFTIRGVLVRDRVPRQGFVLGPRVYIDLADLHATSLLGFGSRASYQQLAKLSAPSAVRAGDALRAVLEGQVASVRTWDRLEDQIGDNLQTAENYLSLTGFVIVVLGGIGVWSVTRVLVQQQIRSVAVLKCLGATSRRVLTAYLLQVAGLSAGGGLVGVLAAALTLRLAPASVLHALGVTRVAMTASAMGQGLAVGLLVSLLFSLVPLLEIRDVKPLLLLRADTTSTARRRDWRSITAGAVVVAALAAVAIWQAGSVAAGLYVCGGLAALAAILYGAARLLVRWTQPLARSSRFAVRHAILGLGRPGNQTRVILLVVGLGTFFILGVRAVEANLLDGFAQQVAAGAPDLVLIDVQADQLDGVSHAIAPFLREPARMMPLLRGRVTAVDGRRLHLATLDEVRKNNRLSREFGLTFRTTLEDNERVDAGAFWTGPMSDARTSDGVDTEVSVWRDLHDNAGVDLGDVIRFDVAGAELRARVTSLRSVAWRNTQNGGFVFVLRPGPAVERLAHNYIGFLQVVDDPSARGALERALVLTSPNVSVIDVRDVLASVRDVVGNVTAAIGAIGSVVFAGGCFILIGAVAMTKFQRIYETAIYRTLGASTRLIASMVAIEYAALGLLAGALGAAGAVLLSWVLARYLFAIDWQLSPGLFLGGIAVVVAVVAAVGLLASADVLMRKPLATLRGEA